MEFSEEYPNKAPKVKFTTKVFHPNGKFFNFCCKFAKYIQMDQYV